jgi:hypothetical protein
MGIHEEPADRSVEDFSDESAATLRVFVIRRHPRGSRRKDEQEGVGEEG